MNNDTVRSPQTCNRCGMSVVCGFGKFVNRIPDLNDMETKFFNKGPFLWGEYVCAECDEEPDK